MLSTPAFNALLKILEEPPAHLLFILATTELHKVPATIKSRCQQFSFKRILPGQIAQRLKFVAGEEKIDLTEDGAALLARLADGGLRDALSLLDQCSGGGQQVNEQTILDTLGLAGNLETAALMEQIAARDTGAALDTLARLYANGKDVASVLGELSSLARDLLLRKTAPRGSAALLAGGYDEMTMRRLGEQMSAQRLLQILTQLQAVTAELPRSSNRRTDAELCLIRLCDEQLDESFAGLSARVARLEDKLSGAVGGVSAASQDREEKTHKTQKQAPDDLPPWEEQRSLLPGGTGKEQDHGMEQAAVPKTTEEREVQPEPAAVSVAQNGGGDSAFWPSFAAGLKGKVSPTVMPYLNNPAKVKGVLKNGHLTLWVDSEFTRSMLNKPAILEGMAQAAFAAFGEKPAVSVVVGVPPVEDAVETQEQREPKESQGAELKDALDELLAFGEQFDNIIIQ